MKVPHTLAFAAVVLAIATGCRSTPRPDPEAQVAAPAEVPAQPSPPSESVQVFQVQGVIKEVRSEGRIAVIRHEEIPGYMAAMTMPFAVKDPKESAGLETGDQVTFRMTVTETDGWIDEIRVRAKGVPEDAKPEVTPLRIVRDVEELQEGDLMPDYPLVTESRRAIRLHDFRGQVLGFTFIYTRCPYPTFCPRQSRQFAEAAAALKTKLPGPPKRWHLLAFRPGLRHPGGAEPLCPPAGSRPGVAELLHR